MKERISIDYNSIEQIVSIHVSGYWWIHYVGKENRSRRLDRYIMCFCYGGYRRRR